MTLARLRALYRRTFMRGYSTGYAAGLDEASHVRLPADVVAAYWRVKEGHESDLLTLRTAQKNLFTVLEVLVEGEVEHA